MNKFLSEAKRKTCKWGVLHLDKQPFIVATRSRKRLVWQEQKNIVPFTLPKEPGIYAVYTMNGSKPEYIGEAGDIGKRIKYHFSDSKSSNKNSTLKKALRKIRLSPKTPLREAFRIRLLPLAFGRKEVEGYLHQIYFCNTARK